MSSIDKLATGIQQYITESNNRKPKPYDTKAEVVRMEGETAWVKIPGGIDETPVQRTNNANVGDTVMVRLAGGRAWLLGNNTSPATDDTQANAAVQLAEGASNIAEVAANAAKSAQESADVAYSAAESAVGDAARAQNSSNIASHNLSIIENIIGVLDLISKHGEYKQTEDLEIDPQKKYFTRSTNSEGQYIYTVVINPLVIEYSITQDLEPIAEKVYYTRTGTGTEEDPYIYEPVRIPKEEDMSLYYETIFYELIGTKDAINNYVSSHLILDQEGLLLCGDNSQYKVRISGSGIQFIDPLGTIASSYGLNIRIGDILKNNIEITDGNIFFNSLGEALGGVGLNDEGITEMFIDKMSVFNFIRFGNFAFINRKNGNLSLKWIGEE